MANEDDRTVVEGGEAEKATTAQSKSGGGMGKILLFGVIGIVAVVVGVVVALLVVQPMISGGTVDGGQQQESVGGDSNTHSDSKKSAKAGTGKTYVYNIEDIVINPAGTGGTRFLSASFAFELESEEAVKAFEAREAIIRDALITILSSKTIAQLTDVKQKEIARFQIKKRIADILRTDELAGVFYTDFVLQ